MRGCYICMKPSIRNLFFFFILYANSFWTQEPIYSYLDNSSYVYGNPAFIGVKRGDELNSSTIVQHDGDEVFVNQSIAYLNKIKCGFHSFGVIVGSNKLGRINQSEKYSGLYSLKFMTRKLVFKIAGQVNYITQKTSLTEMHDLNDLKSTSLIFPEKSIRNNYFALDLGFLIFSHNYFISVKFANLNTPKEATILEDEVVLPIKTTVITSYIFGIGKISILPAFAIEHTKPRYYLESMQNSLLSNSSNFQANVKARYKEIMVGMGFRKVLEGYQNANFIMGYRGDRIKLVYNIGISMDWHKQTFFHQMNIVYSLPNRIKGCRMRKNSTF